MHSLETIGLGGKQTIKGMISGPTGALLGLGDLASSECVLRKGGAPLGRSHKIY